LGSKTKELAAEVRGAMEKEPERELKYKLWAQEKHR